MFNNNLSTIADFATIDQNQLVWRFTIHARKQ